MEPEWIGLAGSIIGLTAAVLSRRRIVEHRHVYGNDGGHSPPCARRRGTTIKVRSIRGAVSAAAACLFLWIASNASKDAESVTVWFWPFLAACAYAGYQAVAVVIQVASYAIPSD